MIESLDLRTSLFISLLNSYFFGLAISFYAFKHKRFRGILTVGTGFNVLGTGFLFLSLRSHVDDFISIVVANTIMLLSFAIVMNGLFRFLNIRLQITNYIAAVSIPLFAFLVYFNTYVVPSVNARIVSSSLFTALYLFVATHRFWAARKAYDRLLMRCLIVIFSAVGVLHLFRAAWMAQAVPLIDFMDAGTLNTATVVASQIIVSYTSLLIIWIASDTLENELATMVRTDSLTSTHNRRALEEYFDMEIVRAIRKGRNFSVLLCDIDHFKSVNDKHGHQFGDDVLVQFASVLKQNVRQMDFVSRYGGEEFVILLPETTGEQAAHIAEKLRRRVMEHGILTPDQSPLGLTASFGVAESGPDGTDRDTILDAADKAMYEAKRQGRNRVVVAGADP